MNPARDWEVLLVADFTADGFAGMLRQSAGPPGLRLTCPGLARVVPTLLDPPAAPHGERWDLAIVWVRPTTALPSLAGPRPDPEAAARLGDEVDGWAAALRRLAGQARHVIVVGWSPDPTWLGTSALAVRGQPGATLLLQDATVRLARGLADCPEIILADPARWLAEAGDEAHVPGLWYLAKVAFGPRVLRAAVRSIRAIVRRLAAGPAKLVVVDLDDTLWGGTLGEVGWEKLRVGGHDAVGEAFADFQRGLRALAAQGVVLAIASRNDEAVALEALRRHPEMVLRPEDFVAWRINWEDKAANLAGLLAELNLGPQSTVFLDNDPAQRERVRGAFPEMIVPELPDDPLLYPVTLARLDVFEAGPVTEEDHARARLYGQRRDAEAERGRFGSVDDWIASLGLEVTFEPFGPGNRDRALQLLNKTNQMNLSTRRLTDAELDAWLAGGRRELGTVRVRDRFGDAGLTGLVSLEHDGAQARIMDFVLSCRVMGRGIEDTMVSWAAERALAMGAAELIAEHRPTERNEPCLKFWRERSGFACDPGTTRFRRGIPPGCPVPAGIRVIGGSPPA